MGASQSRGSKKPGGGKQVNIINIHNMNVTMMRKSQTIKFVNRENAKRIMEHLDLEMCLVMDTSSSASRTAR